MSVGYLGAASEARTSAAAMGTVARPRRVVFSTKLHCHAG